jgi:hypothetical protein
MIAQLHVRSALTKVCRPKNRTGAHRQRSGLELSAKYRSRANNSLIQKIRKWQQFRREFGSEFKVVIGKWIEETQLLERATGKAISVVTAS